MIALTDHNTINGYLDYKKYKNQARQLYQLMLDRDESPSNMSQLASEVRCYDRIAIIPGVEISVYPGIHIILLFEESVVDSVTDFLRNSVGLGDAVITGDPAIVSQLSAVSVLEKAREIFGENFFCILPHIESSKGAWKDLSGQSRADLITDPSVLAVQFLNPDTRKHIKLALGNADYKRKTCLKFIQASDYHGIPSVKPAQQFSLLDSDQVLDWGKLKDAFISDKIVRSSCEHVEERLQEFLKGRPQLQIDFQNNMDLNEDREFDLMKMLSALLNTPSCTLRINLFNASETKSKGAEAIADLIKSLAKKLDPADIFPFNIGEFHDSETRQRFCVYVPKSDRIRLWDNVAWIAGSDGTARPAKAWEIERQVSRSFYNKYGKQKQKSLVETSTELLMISNSFPAFPIASRLDRLLTKKQLPGFSVSFEGMNHRVRDMQLKPENGYATGDCYVATTSDAVKAGRLADDSYYRFTMPVYRKNSSEGDPHGLQEQCAVIAPNGAVTYCKEPLPLYSESPVFIVKCTSLDSDKESCLLGLTAFLKSSFVLWYAVTIHQTDDIFEVLLKAGKLPMPHDSDLLILLSKYAKNIVVSENAFLGAQETKIDVGGAEVAASGEVDSHNNSVLDNMSFIDREVFRHFDFSKDEVEEVYRVINDLDLYDYDIIDNFKLFTDDLFVTHGGDRVK